MNTLNTEPAVDAFWQRFLVAYSDKTARYCDAQQFGDGVAMGNELADLIMRGIKTATCSCLWEWQAEGESLPAIGTLDILLDGEQRPCAVIELVELTICAFEDVDAQFAFDEGEADRTLAAWRDIHWQWFSTFLPIIERTPSMTMPLVCERFRVLYQE
jgi:uncharacterized protein YhfF